MSTSAKEHVESIAGQSDNNDNDANSSTSPRAATATVAGAAASAATAAAAEVTIGLIADIQYADCEDGTDFAGVEIRRFRNALEITRDAIRCFKHEAKVDFMLNLGDIIDGRNKKTGEEEKALDTVVGAFEDVPHYDCIGNHELYCFDRPTLAKKLNCSIPRPRGNESGHDDDDHNKKGELKDGAEEQEEKEEPQFYFSFHRNGWKFVILDPYDVSVIGYPEDHPKRVAGMKILSEANPAFSTGSTGAGDWFNGLAPDKYKYVPYNGAIGPEQHAWLRETLREDEHLPCIIFTHIPILPPATGPRTVTWDADETRAICGEFPNVIAVFAGHCHTKGHAFDEHGIPHVSVPSPMLSDVDGAAYGVLRLSHGEYGVPEAHLQGVGDLPSVNLRRLHKSDDDSEQIQLMKPLWGENLRKKSI